MPRLWRPQFWFSLLYDIASNFGRSLARPFLFWLLGIGIAASYYLGQHLKAVGSLAPDQSFVSTLSNGFLSLIQFGPESSACAKLGTTPFAEALYLASKTALVFREWDRGEEGKRVFACLFDKTGELATVPTAVSYATNVQTIYALILIFLFGLAVRNLLKLK